MIVGIIGSAGRKEDAAKWSREVYVKAFNFLKKELEQWSLHERTLISGGAAWADHLAVSLYLAGHATNLHIEAPCQFVSEPIPKFYDTGEVNWITNPGGTLNYYHRLFSKKMGSESLAGIAKAIRRGAVYTCHYEQNGKSSLHLRNTEVARQSEKLYAFTWGSGAVPKDGGTKHTWDRAFCDKLHVPLGEL